MSKRKISVEEEFNRLSKKIKKLERKIRARDGTTPQQSVLTEPDPVEGPSLRPSGATSSPPPEITEHDMLELFDQEIEDIPASDSPFHEQVPLDSLPNEQDNDLDNLIESQPSNQPILDLPVMATNKKPDTEVAADATDQVVQLDEDVLEILGNDPTSTIKYGPDIRTELTSRFQHIATEGLSKETRKELIDKYPLPANCLQVGAPTVNPEIKAALVDSIVKRDKGIEAKQKEMASAISCLTDIISDHLNSKDKNNIVLQKLMDASRILCDIQHGDSVTRRNFILFAVKNDMQEHLKNTKIDTFLFGENLSDTLKSARAVNKTGDDLKVPDTIKNQSKKAKPPTTQPLNRTATAPPRRPAGAAMAPRGRAAPPAYRARYPAPPPAPAYRTSSMLPPPPPPRRRY